MSAIASEAVQLGRWLDVVIDSRAQLHALPGSLALADLQNDAEYKLIAAHVPLCSEEKPKLKVFKGASQISEHTLTDIPSGIAAVILDDLEPRLTAIAVACGSDVLLYRNLKPYFKFTLPSLEVLPLEKDVWRQLSEYGKNERLVQSLREVVPSELTAQSQKLLLLTDDEQKEFIGKVSTNDLVRRSTITCIDTLQKGSGDPGSAECIVLTTEHGDLLVLDSTAFTILHQAKISPFKSSPCLLTTSGQFDVEYRCVVITRDGCLCLVRKDWLEGRLLVRLDSPAVAIHLIPQDQSAVVASMDSKLTSYSRKGRRLWCVHLGASVSTMCTIHLPHLGASLTAVGLQGGAVQCFNGKHLVDSFSVPDTVSAMKFGPLGQEENVLVVATNDGSLLLKILKRTADFNIGNKSDATGGTPSQPPPLQLPKKTKIFMEQSLREREQASEIHQTFQQELWRLRLTAARATVETLLTADSAMGLASAAPIKLSAQVLGLGPRFRLALQLENMSQVTHVGEIELLVHADHEKYTVTTPYMKAPLLVPGVSYSFETRVVSVLGGSAMEPPFSSTGAPSLRVMVMRRNQANPLIAATVQMPPTELIGLSNE